QRTLPSQRLIPIGEQRLLLTHAHYPDRAEELVARRDDAWAPKLERRATLGRQAGASIVIFGHTHIPLALPWGELLLINPGALASGNYLTRQLHRSVALMSIDRTGGVFVEHRDLDQPELPFVPTLDLEAGFRAALDTVSASIADPEVIALWPALRALFEPGQLSEAERQALHAVLHGLALPRWAGSDPTLISRAGLEQALRSGLPHALWTRVGAIIDSTGGRDG
ncbi:MAG: metallophosphoesterase family protein, partial [Chloroflexales bacterium]|nr:metallophosphoesterase family protein [Chloroflexales bacterium]